MNLRLFFSTFLLIFLAELGDKTQLAAMARSATGGGKWTVFVAASAALVVSTLIAVLAGSALTRVVPEKYIKMAAGALFLAFGTVILLNALRGAHAPTGTGTAGAGVIGRAVLRTAAEFETASADDYAVLAARADDPALRSLLEQIAGEERDHLDRVRRMELSRDEHPVDESGLPDKAALLRRISGKSLDVVNHAIEHEQATARFYEELARTARLPSLKTAFGELAAEERRHTARLEHWRDFARETGVTLPESA
jgi:rubrerythrin